MGKSTLTLEMIIGAKMSPEYNRTLNKASKSLSQMTGSISRMARRVNVGFWVSQGIRAVKDMTDTYGEFEQAMANTASVANATTLEYEKMWDAARQAGRTTTITATESAEALGYMALAGWDVNSSTRALMPVLRLAEATGADLQTTSDLVTDSMGAMGLSINDLDGYLDKLVATNNNANTTSEMLMQALIRTGGAATTLGVDLDDTITAIGVLGSSGIKAEKAGTALNSIFTRIGTNKNAVERLKELKVEIFDDKKNFIGFEEALKKISKAMKGLPETDRIAALKDLAGTHHSTKFAYLLNSVAEDSKDSVSAWDKLQKDVENSEGALTRMNERATSTLPAAFERLNSAVNDSKIAVTDIFGDDLRLFIDDIALKIPAATDAVADFVQENRRPLLEIAGGIENFVTGAGGKVLDVLEFMVNNQGAVAGVMTSLMAFKVIAPAVETIGTVWTTVKALGVGGTLASLAAAIGPAGWVVGGLTLAAGAAGGLYVGLKQWNAELRDQSYAEHFGDIVLSMQEIEDIADRMVGMGTIDAVTREFDELGSVAGSIQNAADSIDKLNWKVGTGIKLDAEEQRDYKDSIDTFVRSMNDYVTQKGYASEVGLNVLYGKNSKTGKYLKDKLGDYYSDAGAEMSKFGKNLAKYVNKAFDDGILSEGEEKKIREKMARLNRLQNEIAEEQQAAKIDVLLSGYRGSKLSAESYRELVNQLGETQAERDAGIDETTAGLIANKKLTESEKQGILDQGLYNKAISAGSTANSSVSIFMQSYADEMKKGSATLERSYKDILDNYLGENVNYDFGRMFDDMAAELKTAAMRVDVGDKAVYEDIYDQMLPQREELESKVQQLTERGMEIPKEITEAIQNIDFVGLMAGKETGLWDAVANTIVNDPEKMAAFQDAQDAGCEVPEELGKAMARAANGGYITSGVDSIYRTVQNAINNKFSSPITTTASIEVKYNTPKATMTTTANSGKYNPNGTPKMTTTAGSGKYNPNGTPKTNALGGIYNSPILTTFAEEGPEAAIPLDGSSRAKGLWLRAGARLGMGDRLRRLSDGLGGQGSATNNTSITFSPVVTIQGNASESEVNRGIQSSYESFRQMMRQYQRENGRVSYARV